MEQSEKAESHLPQKEFVISDLETLRALSDPIRLQILEALTKQPRTVKQIAKILGSSSTKLYYHIAQLEERGLIRVVDTRIVSGIIEKQYQAIAHSFSVQRSLLNLNEQDTAEGDNTFLAHILSLFDTAKAEISRSAEAGLFKQSGEASNKFNMVRGLSRLNPEQAEAFSQRLLEVVKEFETICNEENENGQDYGLVLGLYPVVKDPDDVEEPDSTKEP